MGPLVSEACGRPSGALQRGSAVAAAGPEAGPTPPPPAGPSSAPRLAAAARAGVPPLPPGWSLVRRASLTPPWWPRPRCRQDSHADAEWQPHIRSDGTAAGPPRQRSRHRGGRRAVASGVAKPPSPRCRWDGHGDTPRRGNRTAAARVAALTRRHCGKRCGRIEEEPGWTRSGGSPLGGTEAGAKRGMALHGEFVVAC